MELGRSFTRISISFLATFPLFDGIVPQCAEKISPFPVSLWLRETITREHPCDNVSPPHHVSSSDNLGAAELASSIPLVVGTRSVLRTATSSRGDEPPLHSSDILGPWWSGEDPLFTLSP